MIVAMTNVETVGLTGSLPSSIFCSIVTPILEILDVTFKSQPLPAQLKIL